MPNIHYDKLRDALRGSLAGGGGFALFVALSGASVANFLFHLVISRMIGPAEYGGLGALLGMLLVLSVPVTALQVAITKEVARGRASAEAQVPNMGPLLSQAVLWGSAISLLVVAGSPMIKEFLRLPSFVPAAMLAGYVIPGAVSLVPRAVLLGELRFRRVAFATIAGAVLRLPLGVVLVSAGFGATGAMASGIAAEVLTAMILLHGSRALATTSEPGHSTVRVTWGEAWFAIVAFSGFWLLTSVDVVLARHYLTGARSGIYAAAATGARAAMFLPGSVAVIALPRFAVDRADPGSRRALLEAAGVVTLLSAAAAGALLLLPGLTISILFGPDFKQASSIIGVLAIASGFLGVVNVLLYFHVGHRNRVGSFAPWIGFAAMSAVGMSQDITPRSLSISMVGVTGAVATIMLITAVSDRQGSRESQVTHDKDWGGGLQSEVGLTLVVPFFNGGEALRSNLERLVDVMAESGEDFEIIAVSDGSTDGSETMISGLASERIRVVHYSRNHGKGQALRVGLALGHGKYLGFIDADGDIDPSALSQMVSLVRLYAPDVILGSKRHPLSSVEYPLTRRIYSWGYQQLVHVMFDLNIRDTQTGLKFIRREVLADVLPRMVEKRFVFDLELLVVAQRLGHRRFFEAPITIRHQFSSTVSARSVYQMTMDTLAVFYRLRVLRHYDRAPVMVVDGEPLVERGDSPRVDPPLQRVE